MLSAQCQSDEDWHAGKLSFIFNVSAWEQGFSTPASFFPLSPPFITKGRTLFIQSDSQPGQSEGERDREGKRDRERVREGERKKKRERETEGREGA